MKLLTRVIVPDSYPKRKRIDAMTSTSPVERAMLDIPPTHLWSSAPMPVALLESL
ncbi:hypothetical protein PHLCEN_2v9430 [Hermanssonia centrifuga]|uniref:Uncharacterized protein n=1 Tax=Hermanssonia centrifuga TaxID=98765 RepID=A0A2R6NRK1_9APHY|nr:hypothetical protein PHLCEN_2v9430 [Hermanssonia centrifuga]